MLEIKMGCNESIPNEAMLPILRERYNPEYVTFEMEHVDDPENMDPLIIVTVKHLCSEYAHQLSQEIWEYIVGFCDGIQYATKDDK